MSATVVPAGKSEIGTTALPLTTSTVIGSLPAISMVAVPSIGLSSESYTSMVRVASSPYLGSETVTSTIISSDGFTAKLPSSLAPA